MYLIGIDIGGTKCAVVLGRKDNAGGLAIIEKRVYSTRQYPAPGKMLAQLTDGAETLLLNNGLKATAIAAIGVSCGGPLNSESGVILSPPNLPGWDAVPVVDIFSKHFNCATALQNDADASALAEWKYGAGKGLQHMVFLSFGTGMGAGLILNGKLYSGANGMAGEIGHVRLEENGPTGYGKAGSFEGFCSGGGIAQLARTRAMEELQKGHAPSFCKTPAAIGQITAAIVAEAAEAGDGLAQEIYQLSGTCLGRGIAILVDLLNPELIVIGSIYVKSASLMAAAMEKVILSETIDRSRKACRIVPAALGESIGDYAALSVAANKIAEAL